MRLLYASLVAGLIVIAPHLAAASDLGEPQKARVVYDEADLNTAQGVNAVYRKLRAASRHVCAALESRELQRRALWQDCYTTALSRAVAQVNRASLTALHQHFTKGDRAS